MGDVDFDGGARDVAGWITLVPGGVGTMTIPMFLINTYSLWKRANDDRASQIADASTDASTDAK